MGDQEKREQRGGASINDLFRSHTDVTGRRGLPPITLPMSHIANEEDSAHPTDYFRNGGGQLVARKTFAPCGMRVAPRPSATNP
jgi:hypothetical protein